MIQRNSSFTTGHFGLFVALLLTLLMSVTEFYFGDPRPHAGVLGICLPSPNQWNVQPITSAIINFVCIAVASLGVHILNKRFGIVRSTDTIAATCFAIFCGSNTWINGEFNSSIIICLVIILSLWLLFQEYRSRQSMQTMFLIGTFLSIGSMFQYGFLFFIPAFLIIPLMLKALTLRSFFAFFMGIGAPYWIGIGTGLLPLDSFRFPIFSNIFDDVESRQELFMGLINLGLTTLLGISLALYNAVKIYAGNTRRRILNNSILIIGLTCIVCMLFDIHNIHSYIATLYMVVAYQVANLFDLHSIKRPGFWFTLITMLYIVSFLIMEQGVQISFNKFL